MTVAVSCSVRATPEAAWELLSSTRTWTTWGPSITGVDPADARVSAGLHGRVRTPVGLWMPFHITQCDPPRSWTWTVAGIPATGHHVEPESGGCRVSFTAPVIAFPYLAICRVALARIAALLETGDGA